MKKDRVERDVLFIDASELYEKDRAQNKLTDEHVDEIVQTYFAREDVEKFSHLASFDEVKKNDFNLNIPRYVDTFEEEEPIDMVAVGKELKEIRAEKKDLEKELSTMISSLQAGPENEEWLQAALEVFMND